MTDWPVKTLGEVCEVVNGATPDTKVEEYWGGRHAWITPAEMGNLDSPFLSMSRRTLSDEGLASCSASLVPPRTVILSSRAPIGHLVINEVPMATNQGCKSLIPKVGLDFKFLYYYLKANVKLLDSLGTGTTFKELSGTQLKTVDIPVPPLEEQKRIVALLDAATARVTELTACYEQARTHANNLFASALKEVLEDESDWPTRTLNELATIATGKIDVNAAVENGAFPFFTCSRDVYKIDDAPFQGKAILVAGNGDLNVKYYEGRFNAYQRTYFLFSRDENECFPRFIYWFLENHLDVLRSGASGSTIKYIRMGDLADASVALPPLEEQKQIVARLDSMRAKTSEMVAAYDAKLTAAKNLRQSILESAFAGDL